jgi:hypothetical protein
MKTRGSPFPEGQSGVDGRLALSAKINSRQEKFAQNLAKGMTQQEAYAKAGYNEHAPNANRLRKNEKVEKRIDELRKRAALRTGITIENLTKDLLGIVEDADALPPSAGALNAKRAAIMDIAQLNGLIVSKSEAGKPGDFATDKIFEGWKAKQRAKQPQPRLDC